MRQKNRATYKIHFNNRILNNIKNDFCRKCYDIEENEKVKSQRLIYNKDTNINEFNFDNLNDDYTLKYYNLTKL
ncbi:MAG TPA: hypothetical protein PLI57_11250, partial [Spirochaetota bacterium]|nr:hypothetical protein [Spirochaetota bacterium]